MYVSFVGILNVRIVYVYWSAHSYNCFVAQMITKLWQIMTAMSHCFINKVEISTQLFEVVPVIKILVMYKIILSTVVDRLIIHYITSD